MTNNNITKSNSTEIVLSAKKTVVEKKKKPYYIDDEVLLQEIILSKAQGKLTQKAEKMLILLANRTIKKKKYYYDAADRDDCFQAGMYVLLNKWHKFDETKYSKPFPYLTEIFKRAIAAGFNSLYKKKGDPNGKVKMVSLSGSPDNDNSTVNWI